MTQNSSESRREQKDSVSIPAPLVLRSFSLETAPELNGHGLSKGEWSHRASSGFVGAVRQLPKVGKGSVRSTQDWSGNSAHELETVTRSSIAPIPEMWTILVLAEELAHNKESGSRSAKRADGSARAATIAPEDVRES